MVLLIVAGIFVLQGTKAPAASGADPNASTLPTKNGFNAAPELQGIAGYINAPDNFTLSSQKGNVILVDFWTYSCINCIRTLPHLKEWHDKYKDQGLVIVGVHTPEFEFEKEYQNVQAEVRRHGINYPVVQDNDYATWRAYQNHYWPHKYLIDADGYIRYDHIGEGAYEETEEQIRKLLRERDANAALAPTASPAAPLPFNQIGTPEIYFGYKFIRQPFGNDAELVAEQPINFSFLANESFTPNLAYLDGTWILREDFAELLSDSGRVALVFQAKNANIVAGADPRQTLDVTVDGLKQESIPVADHTLYPVIESQDYSQKTLVINASKGLKLYTFTFG